MSKKSIGGMKEDLLFYKVSDVESDGFGMVIGYKANAVPYVLECVKDTVSFESSSQNLDGEEYFSSEIKGVISDVNPSIQKIITEIKRNECIGFATTKTGRKVQFGNAYMPLILDSSVRVSENHSFNGLNIVIKWNYINLPDFR